MVCIVKKKKHHLKVLFKEMQFVAFFIFRMGKTRMQVKNDLRCLRQKHFDPHEKGGASHNTTRTWQPLKIRILKLN